MNRDLKYFLVFELITIMIVVSVLSSVNTQTANPEGTSIRTQNLVELQTNNPDIKCYAIANGDNFNYLNCVSIKP